MSTVKWIVTVSVFIFMITASASAVIPEGAKAVQVSGGEAHTLLLTEAGFVWGCGYNEFYQLGIGSDYDKWTLIRTKAGEMSTASGCLEDINDIDGGWKHSLALDVNGSVWAWGNNNPWGQLGDGTDDTKSIPVSVKSGDQDPGDPDSFLEGIIAISAGRSGEQSLAVDCNNHLWAWGRNKEGQLGIGIHGTGEKKLTPVQVLGGEMGTTHIEDIIAVSAGEHHSMALDANGFVYTWGSNRWPADDGTYEAGSGKLGIGTGVALEDTPMKVHGVNDGSLDNIVAIAAGWDHCMALEKHVVDFNDPNDPNNKGRVYTWGNNGAGYGNGGNPYSVGGRLGDGTTTNSTVPVFVLSGEQDPCQTSPLTGIVTISAGEGHCLALDCFGFVWAWGDNYSGQLGNATNDPCTTPVKVVGPAGKGFLNNIVAIAAGYWHSIAVGADGTVYTWGNNSAGRLGLGHNNDDSNTPCRIAVVRNITQGTAGFRIQAAADDANDGDVIVAPPAIYHETINLADKSLTVRSTDPDDPDVVAATIIRPNNPGAKIFALNNNPGTSLAGFTLTKGGNAIDSCQSAVQVRNCIIDDNWGRGVSCTNNYPTPGDYSADIKNCRISNNSLDGIYCTDCDLTVTRCIIEDNGAAYDAGIYGSSNSSLVLTNSRITGHRNEIKWYDGLAVIENCFVSDTGRLNSNTGIYLSDPDQGSAIRNCTVVYSGDYGISMDSTVPTISNCIVWGPNSNPFDASNYDVTYSCVQGGYTGDGNISSDPCFIETGDPCNNYHLDANSLCIDVGNPAFEPDANETDIDGDDRLVNGCVDMGADEYYYSPADYDQDQIVNFLDYTLLAAAWQSGDSPYSLDDDNDVDIEDLAVFCADWLWQPAWQQGEQIMGVCGMGGQALGIMEVGLVDILDTELTAEILPRQMEFTPDYERAIKILDDMWYCGLLKPNITDTDFLLLRQKLEELLEQ